MVSIGPKSSDGFCCFFARAITPSIQWWAWRPRPAAAHGLNLGFQRLNLFREALVLLGLLHVGAPVVVRPGMFVAPSSVRMFISFNHYGHLCPNYVADTIRQASTPIALLEDRKPKLVAIPRKSRQG
jgi:hypothetical protein